MDQHILDFITIEIINVEQQTSPENDIITFPMDPIINRSFNKHIISWEIFYRRLLHTSENLLKQFFIIKILLD